ncbi:tetratricopeptide repeat protein [Rugamonas sp.]|uniref:tetratricopeptide repeat protein n=1 Tax=Rugamonas sp. TaxID=1926287 RepID=UPI0025F3E7C8|nr:tetratricopeptide repeat protein [Rugamonas sp.]
MTAIPTDTAALLQQAVALHQQGQLDAALALYQQVLARDTRQFDALHLSGVIARQHGQPQRAADLIARAIAVDPRQAAAHCNLGAALQDLGRTPQALASYERAVELHPGYALAYCNRGNALRQLDRRDEALRSYDRALLLRPRYPEAACHRAMLLNDSGLAAEALASADLALADQPNYVAALCARANALQGLQRFREAVESYDRALALDGDNAEAHCWRGTAMGRLHYYDDALHSYERAIALRPHYPLAHQYRGNTLRDLARADDAIAAYRLALAQGADAAQIAYALAALGAADAPAAAPSAYVASLFDRYADHFDQHLVQDLDYRMPALLDAAIRRHLGGDALDVLDLGCGTGLFAPYLRRYARTLTGVDLSRKMLDKAGQRGLYDELHCAELGQFLAGRVERHDLIVAADVFVYIGDLAPVFAQVAPALRPRGGFCFSVEASDGDGGKGSAAAADIVLGPSRRYAHSLPYLRRLAAAHGFELLEAQPQTGRREDGAAVPSYAVYLRSLKTAGHAGRPA